MPQLLKIGFAFVRNLDPDRMKDRSSELRHRHTSTILAICADQFQRVPRFKNGWCHEHPDSKTDYPILKMCVLKNRKIVF